MIKEMLELKDIHYISTPRPGKKRGGGAALAFNPVNFTLKKLNIAIPKPVEAVWGILRPKYPNGEISEIIVCCFYSPPSAGKNLPLVDHVTKIFKNFLSLTKMREF